MSSQQRTLTRDHMISALTHVGLVQPPNRIGCPQCRKQKQAKGKDYEIKPGKVRVFKDGGMHCHRCGFHARTPFAVLKFCGVVGRKADDAIHTLHPEGFDPASCDRPATKSDPEVYEALLSYASVAEAVKFYGRFDIPGPVVRQYGAARIERSDRVFAQLVSDFGFDRVNGCGLVSTNGKFMGYPAYPVVEPQHDVNGRVVGLQFRASESQEQKIAAHKRGEGPYVPKFLAPLGTPPGSRPGFGLHLVAALPAGSQVVLVEGFKDTLAAAALGANAYGLPGAGCPVPEEALPVLADKHVVVAFDGDEAGQEGTLRIVRQLHAVGIRTSVTKLPDELDVTDLLVRSRTHSPVG